jgi:hypothetical protein
MAPSPEKDIMSDGIDSELSRTYTNIIAGLLEYAIGLCFFVLGSATLGYLNNEGMVVFALLVMNIALVFFLVEMWNSYAGALKSANLNSNLAMLLDEADFSNDSTAVDTLFKCFDSAGYRKGAFHEAIKAVDPTYSPIYANAGDASLVEVESDALETLLCDLCLHRTTGEAAIFTDVNSPKGGSRSTSKSPRGRSKSPARAAASSKSPRSRSRSKSTGTSPRGAGNSSKAKTPAATTASGRSRAASQITVTTPGGTVVSKAKVARSVAAYGLRVQATKSAGGAFLELVYFALNLVAFYGYSLSILAFYYASSNEMWHRALKFGMTHADSDWWGSLAGDLAWTIEPALVLYLAFSARKSQTQTKKVKKD